VCENCVIRCRFFEPVIAFHGATRSVAKLLDLLDSAVPQPPRCRPMSSLRHTGGRPWCAGLPPGCPGIDADALSLRRPAGQGPWFFGTAVVVSSACRYRIQQDVPVGCRRAARKLGFELKLQFRMHRNEWPFPALVREARDHSFANIDFRPTLEALYVEAAET
jgi:hypothetical protein